MWRSRTLDPDASRGTAVSLTSIVTWLPGITARHQRAQFHMHEGVIVNSFGRDATFLMRWVGR
jgi:hypothetical protein